MILWFWQWTRSTPAPAPAPAFQAGTPALLLFVLSVCKIEAASPSDGRRIRSRVLTIGVSGESRPMYSKCWGGGVFPGGGFCEGSAVPSDDAHTLRTCFFSCSIGTKPPALKPQKNTPSDSTGSTDLHRTFTCSTWLWPVTRLDLAVLDLGGEQRSGTSDGLSSCSVPRSVLSGGGFRKATRFEEAIRRKQCLGVQQDPFLKRSDERPVLRVQELHTWVVPTNRRFLDFDPGDAELMQPHWVRFGRRT